MATPSNSPLGRGRIALAPLLPKEGDGEAFVHTRLAKIQASSQLP